jgi:hypothetical protein
MGKTTLDQVQRLVDDLTPLDQVRLLAYLTPRIAQTVAAMYPSTSTLDQATAWGEFFRIGDALTTGDKPEAETLTSAVVTMRR